MQNSNIEELATTGFIILVLVAITLGIAGWLAYFVMSHLYRLWTLKRLHRRPTHDRLFIYTLGQSQRASWITRIMNNGEWRKYEDTKHYLVPEDRIWNHIVGQGARGLKPQS